MAKPKVLASQTLYRGYIDVKLDTLHHNGHTLDYTHVSLSSDAVVILALTPEKQFLFNREYRHPTHTQILGLPGGKLEYNEDPIDGALRELLEETGYHSPTLTLLGITYHMPALCNQKVYFVLAENATPQGPQQLEPFEFITPELKTLAEIKKDIASGAILDSHLLAALTLYQFKQKI